MNNPQSDDPRHALFPHPPGCTGHRLWRMLHERCGAESIEYVTSFDRRNLVTGTKFTAERARRGAQELLPRLTDYHVVLLGSDTVRAFGLVSAPALVWQAGGGPWARWCRMPHPSGRNLWFNDEVNRLAAGLLLEELFQRYGARAGGSR